MLGEKRLAPKLVYQFTLEERVPPEHLLRRVAAAVDFSYLFTVFHRGLAGEGAMDGVG